MTCKSYTGRANINIYNGDCMEFMKDKPAKSHELAICDPPYGINADIGIQKNNGNYGYKVHKQTNWDTAIPDKTYFDNIFNLTGNQIVWGGNYFTKYLPPVMSWIVWDKMQYNFSFSHGEMAWSSFDTKLLIYRYARGNESGFAQNCKVQ